MQENLTNFSQAERREEIIYHLKQNGSVRVSELSEALSTSEVTIRSDLMELEKAGILQRVHGGAIQTVRNYYALDSSERLSERKAEKLQIASIVSKLINDGDNIIMNSGSTNYYVALDLCQKKNLRVITNSIQISEVFVAHKNIEVILLGGIINYQYMFTYGDDTASQLHRYQVDKTILSADGVDFSSGITTYHYEVAELCSRMMQKASTNIIAADHTKIGHTAFSHIADLAKVNYLATDEKSKNLDLQKLKELDIKVVTL